jgi:type II secretory pathway component PulF
MAIATISRKVKKTGEDNSFFENIKNLDLNINFHSKVSTKEIIFFTSQLSLMVEIGTPLNVSLSTIAKQIKNPEFRQAVTKIISEVEKGRMLSDALGIYPHIFSDVYISLIKAGENTGQLKDMLDRVVAVQEKQEKFVGMLKQALTYPVILCFVSVAVIIFLLAFVFPRFAVLFKEIEDILPVTTKLLILLSDSLRSHWHIAAALLGISCWGIYTFIKSNKGRLTFDKLKVNVPILANIYIKIYLTQTMRTLGFLMGSNVPLMDALRIARRGTKNLIFAGFIEKIAENAEEGRGMSLAFTESAFIPENARQIMKTGEETQNLPKVMLRLSDYYEKEIDDQMKRFSTIIEPVLLIMMGTVVGGIVMSLILPIFKLSRAMH